MSKSNALIFSFESIVFLSNRDLWLLLSETDNVTILQACQKADSIMLLRIRSVFTKTACNYFNDDLNKFMGTSNEEIAQARERMTEILYCLGEQGRLQDWFFEFAN